MLSGRKRRQAVLAASVTPGDLRERYLANLSAPAAPAAPAVSLAGGGILPWLVHASSLPPAEPIPLVDLWRASARHELDLSLEPGIAAMVMQSTQPRAVLEMCATYFHAARSLKLPESAPATNSCGTKFDFLSPRSVARSLVVPDVRRMALQLAIRGQIRWGEMAYVKHLDNSGVVNASAVCNQLRTGEFMCHIRETIMYGKLDDINNGNSSAASAASAASATSASSAHERPLTPINAL